jgi:glycosyltransferase involved in cell wall biosynthesis
MRVALDVTPLLGARTGVAQTVLGLLDALPTAAPGIEILPYVLSGRARTGGGEGLPPGTRFLPIPAGLALRAWGRFDLPTLGPWLGRADVVHGSNFVVPPMRGRPTSVTVHDCWCARHPESCDPVARSYTATLHRAVARGAWLHVSTQAVAEDVREIYGATRVAVVPFGVPPVVIDDPSPGADGGPPFVLTLAAMDPRKGLDALVRAFGLAVADGHVPADLRLVLAGHDGPARAAVDAAVAALPPEVARRVDLLGPVDDAHRRRLLHGAVALAYPSRSEGFGFPLLEAMATGTPVVATAVGSIPEVAGDAALLVPLDDDAALAGTLARVVADDGLRAQLRAAGRSRAASFSWDRTASGLAELWRSMAGRAAA